MTQGVSALKIFFLVFIVTFIGENLIDFLSLRKFKFFDLLSLEGPPSSLLATTTFRGGGSALL